MNLQKFLSERRSTISSGILALVIIVVGFLAFNSLSQSPSNTKTQKQETKSQQKPVDATQHTQTNNSNGKVNAVTHTVVSGESLSQISKTYYGDGNKWTLIATENKLANPEIIHRGNVLVIPGISSTDPKAVATTPATSTKTPAKTYIVKSGDCLWTISQAFYNGDGYQWFKIRDANPGKVGLLANGRPLIVPGTVLTIPTG